MINWRIYAASAIGKGHIDVGLPCQDAFAYKSGNGRLVAVVCDGAGSASRSEIGATSCANTISSYLADLLGEPSLACSKEVIEKAVEAARSIIEARAVELALPSRELACTLVGAVIHENGGCLFHVGDGVGVAELDVGPPVLSLPENGEYANETYFVTQDEWQSRLHIVPFAGSIRCIALMSDGAMSFAFKRDGLFGPFIDPVKSFLTTVTEVEGSEALQATLAGEGTWKITGDDKTILLVLPS
jgi:hypothetical protein